jgi:glutaredoxin
VPPTDHTVTLLTRPGCHLCDDARTALAELAADLGFAWDERDVSLDDADEAEYGDRVPVVLLDGREHGYWRVETARLRRDLAR